MEIINAKLIRTPTAKRQINAISTYKEWGKVSPECLGDDPGFLECVYDTLYANLTTSEQLKHVVDFCQGGALSLVVEQEKKYFDCSVLLNK